MRFDYRNPKDKIETREENGFRVSLLNDTYRFPTEITLKEIVQRVNALADNHAQQSCPAEQECQICFLTKVAAESTLFNKLAEETLHKVLVGGPLSGLAHEIVDYTSYFSVIFFFFMAGMELAKSKVNATTEVEALNKLFSLENKSDETDRNATN